MIGALIFHTLELKDGERDGGETIPVECLEATLGKNAPRV